MEEILARPAVESRSGSNKMLWIGWVVSGIPVLMLLFSAIMKLMRPPAVLEGFAHLGYPESLAVGLGIFELTCTIVYLIPRTAILGAILLTGYLGGAVTTHLRIGEPYFAPILLGVLVWAGIYLRDRRLGS